MNVFGVVYILKCVLPNMLSRNRGRIIVTNSVAGCVSERTHGLWRMLLSPYTNNLHLEHKACCLLAGRP